MISPRAAWALLEPASIMELLEPPGGVPQALHITPVNAAVEAVRAVPMVLAARLLLEHAAQKGGLVLTPAGFLKRAEVWHVFERTEWPGYDKATTLATNKVINEQEAHGVFFTRIALQAAGLLLKRSGALRPTKLGRALIEPDHENLLLNALFQAVFWKMNLQDFDRNPLEFWPQHHIGLVLWCLSVAAHEWSRAAPLVPICTITATIPQARFAEVPKSALVARVLRPLSWLGLLETRKHDRVSGGEPEFRKTPLFDQMLSFDVKMTGAGEVRH